MMFFGSTLRDTVKSLSSRKPAPSAKDVDERTVPVDITEQLLSWLRKGAADPEFSFMALVNGTGGSGKTSLSMMFATILLNSDKSRTLALWNTPKSLELAIKKQVKKFLPDGEGDKWGDRVITITKVKDVKENYIVLIDEGVLNLNAKRALNDDMVEFEKMITIARHLRLVVLVNSIFKGVAKAFRESSQLKVYKLMPPDTIEEYTKNSFVKENQELLTRLKKPEALIECSHPGFMKRGYIYMDLLDYCPWYNMEISKSMGATGDADFGKDKRESDEDRIREVADRAMEALGAQFGFESAKSKKWNTQAIIRAWMRDQKLEDYSDLEKKVGKIVDTITYRLLTFEQTHDMDSASAVLAPTHRIVRSTPTSPTTQRQDDAPPELSLITSGTGTLISDGFDYGQFFYDCATSQNYDEKDRLLAKLTMQGYTLSQLCEHPDINMSETWVTTRRSEMLADWFGYWAEWAWVRVLGEQPNSDIYGDRPDLILAADRDYMGITLPMGTICSIKFKIEKTANLKFSQWTEGDDRGDLNPEYSEAVARGTPYYLVILNPRWSVNHFYLKEIDPTGTRIVEVRKPRGRNSDAVLLP